MLTTWCGLGVRAFRARPGWSLAAAALAAAALACLGIDHAVQPLVRTLDGCQSVAALVELVRPFGRGEVAVLVALAIGLSGRRALAGRLLAALAVAAVLTWALKLGVGRIRPNGQAWSFVSGDTSTIWALVPLLARGWLGGLGLVAIAAGVAASRVVLGYHWPADVLGGAAVGLAGGILAAGAWPWRPWPWLLSRRLWTWLGAAAFAGAIAWAALSPKAGWLRTFLLVWSPALLGWVLWSRLRHRFAHGLPAVGWAPWLVAGLLAAALAGLAVSTTLMDRDEPRNALAAREMIASGDWLVPTFNGEWRLHKPILPYWLMTLVLRTGLPPDVACRLPAVLCMAAAVALSALTARRIARAAGCAPGRIAIATALVLATSPLVVVSGSAATTDAALLLGIAAAMWLLVDVMLAGRRWWHLPLAGLAVGWAVLAKGPMGLLVPVATVLGCAMFEGGRWRGASASAGPQVRPAWGLLGGAVVIGSALALGWFIPANAATGGAMFDEMIGNQVVKRAMEARESHGGGFWISLPYYLPVLLASCIAWLPALAVALRAPAAGLGRGVAVVVLAWAVPVLVAVTLVQTKLPHYLLPMLPPLAILLAVAMAGEAAPGWWRWGGRIQTALLALLATGLLVAPAAAALLQDGGVVPARLGLAPLLLPAAAIGLGLLVLAVAGRAALRRRERGAYAGAAAIGMAAVVAALALNAWRLEAFKPAPRAAAAVRGCAPGTPVVLCGFDEPSLLFYIGPERGPVRIMSSGGDLKRWSGEAGPGVCVAERRRWYEAGGDALPLRVIGRYPGYNYSNGRLVELIVATRAAR